MLTRKRLGSVSLVLVVVIALLAACIAPPAANTGGGATQSSAQAGVAKYTKWDDVLAAAKDTTVNWYMWGGSDTINAHVDKNVDHYPAGSTLVTREIYTI